MSQETQHRKPPEGHVFIITGTPIKADRLKISLPIICRELVVGHDGIKALKAFTSGVVQHESRTLLRPYQLIIGDVDFEASGFNFDIHREERWMSVSHQDMIDELDAVSKTPASIIEEQVTSEIMRSLRRRSEMRAPQN